MGMPSTARRGSSAEGRQTPTTFIPQYGSVMIRSLSWWAAL